MPTLMRVLILIFQRNTIGKSAKVKSVKAAITVVSSSVQLLRGLRRIRFTSLSDSSRVDRVVRPAVSLDGMIPIQLDRSALRENDRSIQ